MPLIGEFVLRFAKWIIAPLAVPLLMWLIGSVFELIKWAQTGRISSYWGSPSRALETLSMFILMVGPYAYGATLLIGAPGAALLRKTRRETPWAYGLVGTVGGMAPAAFLILMTDWSGWVDPRPMSKFLGMLLWCVPLGVISALLFWRMDRKYARQRAASGNSP